MFDLHLIVHKMLHIYRKKMVENRDQWKVTNRSNKVTRKVPLRIMGTKVLLGLEALDIFDPSREPCQLTSCMRCFRGSLLAVIYAPSLLLSRKVPLRIMETKSYLGWKLLIFLTQVVNLASWPHASQVAGEAYGWGKVNKFYFQKKKKKSLNSIDILPNLHLYVYNV